MERGGKTGKDVWGNGCLVAWLLGWVMRGGETHKGVYGVGWGRGRLVAWLMKRVRYRLTRVCRGMVASLLGWWTGDHTETDQGMWGNGCFTTWMVDRGTETDQDMWGNGCFTTWLVDRGSHRDRPGYVGEWLLDRLLGWWGGERGLTRVCAGMVRCLFWVGECARVVPFCFPFYLPRRAT